MYVVYEDFFIVLYVVVNCRVVFHLVVVATVVNPCTLTCRPLQTIAMACFFLAIKVEEGHAKLKDLVSAHQLIRNQPDNPKVSEIELIM